MPKYIDFHAQMPAIPPEALSQVRASVGKTDTDGVKNINAYFTKDGQGYCVTEAPNPDAVCQHHKAMGIALDKGEVHEITTTLV